MSRGRDDLASKCPVTIETGPLRLFRSDRLTKSGRSGVVWWITRLNTNPGLAKSNPRYSGLSDETLNRGPVSL